MSFKMTALLSSFWTTDAFSSLSPWLNARRVPAAAWCVPQFNYDLIDFSCISIFSSLSHSGCPVGAMFGFLSQISVWSRWSQSCVLCLSSPGLPPPPRNAWPWAGAGSRSRKEPCSPYEILKRKAYPTACSPTKGTWFLNGLSLWYALKIMHNLHRLAFYYTTGTRERKMKTIRVSSEDISLLITILQ